MTSLIASALLSLTLSAPVLVLADGAPTTSIAPAVAASSVGIARAANANLTTLTASETPAADCCYDAVNLDREPPQPRAARGPSCCWDESVWD